MKQFKRILAILAVVIIAGLYIATLICAIFVKHFSNQMFMACIVATVMVPLLLYLLFWLYDMLQSRTNGVADQEDELRKGFAAAAAFNQGKKFVDEDRTETRKIQSADDGMEQEADHRDKNKTEDQSADEGIEQEMKVIDRI